MKLSDLHPSFVVPIDECSYHLVDTMSGAQGITFLCPKCLLDRPDGVGVHRVLCWQPGVPPSWTPGPGRWSMTGTGYGDLTISP